jgi:hypothetical protein
MGWTFIRGASRSDIITEVTKDQSLADGGVLRTLRKCLRGNTMYSLLECTRPGKKVKLISVTLLQRSSDGWGFKEMDETCGPYYYSCPLSFLLEADAPENETARQWRQSVRDRITADASKRPCIGETWQLASGCSPNQVEITSLKPLLGTAHGTVFRLRRRQLAARADLGVS